jgi:hypothetical protein
VAGHDVDFTKKLTFKNEGGVPYQLKYWCNRFVDVGAS